MPDRSRRRAAAGSIDSGGVYCSLVTAAGGYVFLAGAPIDDAGRLPDAARPPAPYEGSAAAEVRWQTRYLFERYRDLLAEVGSSLGDLLYLEQYVRLKVHTDGYFREALGPGLMETSRPVGATAAVGEYFPADAAISVMGLGIVPDAGRAKSYHSVDPKKPGGQFPEIAAAGPYVCTTYYPTDAKTGIDPAVRTEDWNWRGSEIRSEAEYGVEVMKARLAAVGASLGDIVDYTLFLSDLGDLYEFDLVFGRALGDDAPARTIVPVRGLANPRREGAFGHAQGALRMEAQFRCLRPGHGATKVVVPGPGAGFGYQSAGVRVGPLVWLSSQVADPEARGRTPQELENIVEKLGTVCRNGGTTLRNVQRVRALLTRPDEVLSVYGALRKAVPGTPPAVSILIVPSLHVRGCSVALDAVAYVEDA
jgi:2-aminomuconate deaminase